jgi:hypothetical protein
VVPVLREDCDLRRGSQGDLIGGNIVQDLDFCDSPAACRSPGIDRLRRRARAASAPQ